MRSDELKQVISKSGLPVAVRVFDEPQELPFIIILPTGGAAGGSDFDNEIVRADYHIELYSMEKDDSSEAKIEAIMAENGTKWEKDEDYLQDEAIYMVVYTISYNEKVRVKNDKTN